MRGSTKMNLLSLSCLTQFPQDITFWSHFRTIKRRKLAGIKLKAVVMLSHWKNVLGSCFFKDAQPLVRMKIFGSKEWDKILVSKLFVGSISFDMVVKLCRALDIHISRIPLAPKGRKAVEPPVNKNPKLSPFEPVGDLIGRKRIPVWIERALVGNSLNFF